eukprot:TRINITY_DN2184_c0_g1_i1.p1 TRINITY_DN2184_c0_g1~~TRINITY_DN2184_c0_g1_i1.p1  ORF type:complete len:647 (+),score=145.14 TRINITY_DN2184_c0_g1_i1:130-2070(+)
MENDMPELDPTENGVDEPASTSSESADSRKRKREKNDSSGKKPESAVRYHCNYCNKDISTSVRVKCAVCQDFDLCMECFAVGIEMGNGHRKNHDYFVVDTLSFPFFEDDWGADEELLLLEGIEMYGMSNWSDVSDHVGKHTAAECKDHYYKFYINSPNPPFPDFSRVRTTHETLKEMREFRLRQLQNGAGGAEEPAEEEKADPKYAGSQKAPPQSLVGGHSVADLAGWLAGRGDFETEHDNGAETYLMDLGFFEDDTITERDMKLKLIEVYNLRLDDRAFKKNLIKERNLLEYKKLEKKRKDDKDFHDRLKTFAKVQSAEDHDKFFDGLCAERRIRRRIDQLKAWRMNGIHSLAEGELFETEKRKRETSGSRKRDAALDRSRANKTIASRAAKEAEMEAWQEKLRTKPRKLGVDLLSDNEKDLCSQLRLLPHQYALVKDTLIRECTRAGGVTKQSARQLIKMDVNKTSRIFDFLEGAGWINKIFEMSLGDPPMISPPLSPAGTRYGPPGTPASQMTPEQFAQQQQQHQQQQHQYLQHHQQQQLALKTALPGQAVAGPGVPVQRPATHLVIPQPQQYAPPHAPHASQHVLHPGAMHHAQQLYPQPQPHVIMAPSHVQPGHLPAQTAPMPAHVPSGHPPYAMAAAMPR